MPSGREKLKEVAELLATGKIPEPVTVRTFLNWFNAQRRGFYIVHDIREALQENNLKTDPDFEFEYIDGYINFLPATTEAAEAEVEGVGVDAVVETVAATPKPPSCSAEGTFAEQVPETLPIDSAPQVPISVPTVAADPTYRVGKLAAANRAPVSVKPDSSLAEATTLMLLNGFSQLPVMQTEITLKGVVSWSSIGARLALGLFADKVSNCMDAAIVRSSEDSLFAIIDDIIQNQYVLIRGKDNKIKGIVTTSDLSWQFGQLAEPFLLIGEIEQHIRMLIQGRFSIDDLKAARDPDDQDREITGVQDLAFGEYIRLLENPERWAKLNLQIDRVIFIEQLQDVRKIRNEVMHFDPDGITEGERVTLRQAVHFMQTLQQLGAVKSL